MKRIRRILSFVLAFVMILSSLNLTMVYADSGYKDPANATSDKAGTHSGTGSVSNGTDGYSTGYKVSLVFLPVAGLDQTKTYEERRSKIDLAWNKATPNDAIQIGKTIYLTTEALRGDIKIGFPYNGFTYGLGTVTNDTISRFDDNHQPNIERIKDGLIVTPNDINSAMASLNLPNLGKAGSTGGYLANSMNMDTVLPINMGSQANGKDIRYYFMRDITDAERAKDEDMQGAAYSTASLAGLVNYLATDGGEHPDEFIYFARIKDNTTNELHNYDGIISSTANCFEQGRYNNQLGEYRITVEPYWNVRIAAKGARAALTLRDFAFLYDETNNSAYQKVATEQRYYYGDLGYTTRLRSNDIWGLTTTEVNDWKNAYTSAITQNVKANKGGGLAFFTSSMMQMKVQGVPGYIGSISNVFLPGALDSSIDTIESANLEYIGSRGDQDAVTAAMENAAIEISKALSGGTVDADNNIFANSELNRSALINGVVKIPGIELKSGGSSDFEKTGGILNTD